MEDRGILTEDDRAFWRGEKDVEDHSRTKAEKRHHVRQRIENLAEDVELLLEAGEDDLVTELRYYVGQNRRLEQRVARLERRLDDETPRD